MATSVVESRTMTTTGTNKKKPPLNRRERQVQERRAEILAAALQLFESKGYLETSMEEIAETADVARGTLYNHFESKADVLLALTDSVAEQWQERGRKAMSKTDSPSKAIKEVLTACAEWFDKHPSSAKAFFYAMRELITRHDGGIPKPPRSLVPREYVVRAQEEGEITKEFAPDLVVLLIDTVLKHHLIAILQDTKKGQFAKDVQREISLLLKRLAPRDLD